MKTTYIVEDKAENIIEYSRTLYQAKRILQLYSGHRIIMMRGPHFGEGFHMYQLVWNGKRYQRFYL